MLYCLVDSQMVFLLKRNGIYNRYFVIKIIGFVRDSSSVVGSEGTNYRIKLSLAQVLDHIGSS